MVLLIQARLCSAMLYKFRSKAAGEVIMVGPVGDEILRIIGRQPAAQGVIVPATMPAAMMAIAEAIAREEAQPPQPETGSAEQDRDLLRDEPVTLRQRAWPFVEMMKRAQAENAHIFWGI